MTRRPGALRLTAALVAVASVVGVAGVVEEPLGRTSAAADGAAGGDVVGPAPVAGALLACPGADARTGGTTTLAVATAPEQLGLPGGATTTPGAGEVTATVRGGGAVEPTPVPVPGRTWVGELPAGGWAGIAAEGPAAPGVTGAQLVVGRPAGSRGLSLAPCSATGEVLHLLGGAAGAGRVEQVVLTNPGVDPVTVDLEVLGPEGAVDVSGGTGLVVPPGGRTTHLLDALAPGVASPAVVVSAHGGAVGAHLAVAEGEGTVDLGADVIPAAARPARDLVVPALPGPGDGEEGSRTAVLRLLAADREAVVELRGLTPDGAVAPQTPVVRVPAGSTVDVEVPELARGEVALRLRSDAPVTAAAQLRVAPASDEPVAVDDAATTSAPDDAATTSALDDVAATSAPGETAAATFTPSRQRVVRPAGEITWVVATVLSPTPAGLALPAADGVPGARRQLAVSTVDATLAQVLWLDANQRVRAQEVRLGNDSTAVLDVPEGAAAVWVRPVSGPGVVASVHVVGHDDLGSYLAATTAPAVPWTQPEARVEPVVP